MRTAWSPRTSLTDGTTSHTYDADDQLTSAANPSVTAEYYVYDDNGNWTAGGS